MAAPTIQPGQIKSGPGLILYAPLGTAIPAITAAGSVLVGTFTNWIEVGATDSGLTYTESTDTADITVAESTYPVRTVTTGKTSRVAFTMSHISDTNWQLAMNGGTITVTGTGATKLSVYVPPLMGAEVRKMLAFKSLDNDEIIVWGQVFNVGSAETARGALDTKAGLPVEFAAEIPADTAVMVTPYKRWVSGLLAQGV